MTINYIRTQVEPLGFKYTVRIDRILEDPEEWQEEVATIRQAGEGDVVHLLINSGGGNVDTMKALISALAQSPAHIICEIEGTAASAASMIFLTGDEFRVSDDAEFMAHFVSYGSIGKGMDVKRHVEFTHRSAERLVRKYYNGFLTPEEIERMLEGEEFYMDCDEILTRLGNRTALDKEDTPENVTVSVGELISKLYNSGFDDLKSIADSEGIPYAHNISEEKLRKRILDFYEDTVDNTIE